LANDDEVPDVTRVAGRSGLGRGVASGHGVAAAGPRSIGAEQEILSGRDSI
jgi:hypothetical protein